MVGMMRELVIAWQFGTSDVVDAYLIALALPTFIIIVVVGSFNAAFIPVYIQTRENKGQAAAQRLFSSATIGAALLLMMVAIVVALFSPYLLSVLASGFSAEKLAMTQRLFYSLLPWVVLSAVMQIWSATLNANERFVIVAATPAITSAFTLFMLVVFSSTFGIYALTLGLVGGSLLESVALGAVLRRNGTALKPNWGGFNDDLRRVSGQIFPLIFGSVFFNSNQIVDQAVAASLGVSGHVAALNFGIRLVAVLISVLSMALSTAVIPYFSKLVSAKDWVQLRSTFRKTVLLSLLGTIPLTMGVVVFSTPIIQVFLQRGAFTSEDTQLVSKIQAFAALQIPFFIAANLGVRLISSLQRNAVLMRISIAGFVVNVVADLLLARVWGVAGIALSTTVVYCFVCLMVFGYLYNFTKRKLFVNIPDFTSLETDN
jgi:putative peptidoglycan lipid II flippase